MKETNEEARDRYYKEVSIHLTRSGFTVLPQREGLLPLEWNGASLCRITAGGGAQYRAEELEPNGANEAFHRATEIAATTAEYMQLMETAPPLRAKGLEGDYRLLADFGGAVLAGHPASYGAEFVTWEWDYEHTGMWQGHYYGNNYAGAKGALPFFQRDNFIIRFVKNRIRITKLKALDKRKQQYLDISGIETMEGEKQF